MTVQPTAPHDLSWRSYQVEDVERMMRGEFSELSRGLIAVALRLSLRAIHPSEGVPALLAHVREMLARRQAAGFLSSVS
jgi:hypothetical protein